MSSPRKNENQACLHRHDDGPVVYPADAFDSRLRGDSVPLGSRPAKTFTLS